MTNRIALLCFSSFCALALFLVLGSRILPAQSTDSKEISNLLSEAKTHAALAANDAAEMESFTRSNLSWRSYSAKLETVKTHINNLGKLHGQLADMRHLGSPWQQSAIDQIEPLLQEMADTLTATINHMNDHQSEVHMPPFREYVQANHELTSRMSDMIRDFVAYDAAKAKAASLEHKF